MTPPQPTPEILAAARRVAARQWTLGPNDSYDPGVDPHLFLLSLHRLVALHFASPARQQEGTDEDRWTLTVAGKDWLAQHDTEARGTK